MAKTPEQRAARIRDRFNAGLDDVALGMWRSTPKKQRAEVGALLGELFTHKLEAANAKEKARLQARTAQREAENRSAVEAQARLKIEQHKLMDVRLQETRDAGGNAAREAALSDWQQERLDALLSNPEKAQCRKYRRNALWGKHVCAILDCSQTELDRWDADGRLAHAFKRACSPGGKTVQGRMWFAEDVRGALPQIDAWRAQDEQRKRARRTKLKVVA